MRLILIQNAFKMLFKLQRNVKMSLGKRRVCIDFASTTSKTLYSYFKFDEFIMTNRLLKGICISIFVLFIILAK